LIEWQTALQSVNVFTINLEGGFRAESVLRWWQIGHFSRTKTFPMCSVLHIFAGMGTQMGHWVWLSGLLFRFLPNSFLMLRYGLLRYGS
jgi:hypothetical protein